MRHVVFFLILWYGIVVAQEDTASATEQSDPVLVLTATGGIFDQARNELVNELRDEFSLTVIELQATTSFYDIDRLFQSPIRPKVVVLIGNNAIRFYVKYAFPRKELTGSVQVVTVLALDAERAVDGIENVNAISYETPMVTALVDFRRVVDKPLTKVGVLYRKPLTAFIEKYTLICLDEKIAVIGVEIGDDPSKQNQEIAGALQRLLEREKVDALWIANDDVLLTPNLLGNAWYPMLKKNRVPLIVGFESLVDPGLDFGTFAVIPDPVALGEQAAEIVFNLKLDNWNHEGVTVHPPISMYSVLNMKKATEFVGKENLRTYEVSKILYGKK